MSYIPFARKYRPQNFKELLGQEALTKSLSNAIISKSLSPSLLLSGIRGVGKTSSARLVAKTINCSKHLIEDGIVAACNECVNCLSSKAGNHPDILEIDAASNTGVDDVRQIIQTCEYKPLLGKCKVFIIDEVHMLSRSAFNALLKVIEEPPAHVMFILATTEVHKIPLTIISRCWRYDLRRLSLEEIIDLCKHIAAQESLQISSEALIVVAQKSEGSAREAALMLDQLSSYSQNIGGKIEQDIVNSMLGLVGAKHIVEMLEYIVTGNANNAHKLLMEIYHTSSNLTHFFNDISNMVADVTKMKLIENYQNPLLIAHQDRIELIKNSIELSQLTILWQLINRGILDISNSQSQIHAAEMLLFQAIHGCKMPKMEDLLNLEKAILQQTQISESTNPIPAVVMQDTPKQNISDINYDIILEFLNFCQEQKARSIVYSLLNEVEILHISPGKIEIAVINALDSIKMQELKELLNQWQEHAWQIKITNKANIKLLRDVLLAQANNSDIFKKIKNQFPNSNISDILLSHN